MLSRRFLTERSHAQQCVVQQCVERSVGSCTTYTPDISFYICIYLFLRRASHFEVSKHVGWSIEAFLTNLNYNIIFDIPIVLKTLKSSSHVFVTSSLCTYWDSCFSMNIQTIAWHLDDIETLFNISFFSLSVDFRTKNPLLVVLNSMWFFDDFLPPRSDSTSRRRFIVLCTFFQKLKSIVLQETSGKQFA